MTGEEWRFEYSNPAFARMAGKSLEDLVGKTMNDFIIPEDLPLLAQERLKLLAGQTTACELRLRRSGGEIVHIHATGVPRFHGKRVVGSMSVIADITERKQAEETLRISHQILDGIINAIPVRVFWKDRDLVYLGCNTIFARDAGFTDPKDIIGKDDYQMGSRNQAELYRADDRYVIESGRPKLLIEKTPDDP